MACSISCAPAASGGICHHLRPFRPGALCMAICAPSCETGCGRVCAIAISEGDSPFGKAAPRRLSRSPDAEARIVVPLIGYVDRFSARPGERIAVKVSSQFGEKYRADLVRIIHGDANPAGPGLRFEELHAPFAGTYESRF